MDERKLQFYRDALGARIRLKRIEEGLTQSELAHVLGYSEDTGKSIISKIESGKVEPPPSKLYLFADALNTTILYLMGWDDELSSDERQLIATFRDLNSAGQQTALSMLSVLKSNSEFAARLEEDTSVTSAS